MKDAETLYTATSAMEVLLNSENWILELYDRKETMKVIHQPSSPGGAAAKIGRRCIRLRDRIERLYNVLEKIVDHQAQIMGTNSGEMKRMARKDLEGSDFKDLSTNE